MKLENIVLSIFIITITFSCSSGTRPVAQYKYGTITRGEIDRRVQGVKLTPQLERTIIESLCVEGVALHDALAAGYDKNETYKLRVERESRHILKKYVNEKNRLTPGLSWDYVRCRNITFGGGNTVNTRNHALYKANRIIEALGKGAKFDSLVKSYSTDPQNAVEMSIVFAVKGGGRPEFEEAAFALPAGAYSTEPVVLRNGTAIVFISDEKGSFTMDNLGEKITSSKEKKRVSALIESLVYDKHVSDMEKRNNASFKITELPDKENAVLFSIYGKDYLLRDMLKRRNLFSSIIREPLEDRKYLFGFAKEWYFSELYKSEAEKMGFLKDKKLAAELKANEDFILANDYIRYVCEKDMVISEKDMRDEYSVNKNHYMQFQDSKKKKPVQLPYKMAGVFVKKNLIQSRVAAAMDIWKKNALADSGLAVKYQL